MARSRWVLPLPGGPKAQHVFAAVEKGALDERVDESIDLAGQSRALEGLQGLVQGQVGGPQGALDAALAAHVAFLFDQRQQELLVAGRIGACLLGDLRKAAAHGRQAQLLEPVLQELARVSSGHGATAWANGGDDSRRS